jgi:hypothetical protein
MTISAIQRELKKELRASACRRFCARDLRGDHDSN